MTASVVSSRTYVLETGTAAVRRLRALHEIYAPAGTRILFQAGLTRGMKVADFGCGVGVVTRMLAETVGPAGHVTGIDVSREQIVEATKMCARARVRNTSFVQASAYQTGLPRGSFDLVYCRFLLLHLEDPAACLREMLAVLKPGGILVVEDGDLATAASIPPSAMDAFARLFRQLGQARGVNYSLAKDLYQLVTECGFREVNLEIHQPALVRGENRHFLKWSVEEAGRALVAEGILTTQELTEVLSSMQRVVEDSKVLILAPQMSVVWARKAKS